MITKEKILEAKQNIFSRFDKESTYCELGEHAAREIVSAALDGLINELDSKEDNRKMKARTKEEILEHYMYELRESLPYDDDRIEKILGDMYEEINAA